MSRPIRYAKRNIFGEYVPYWERLPEGTEEMIFAGLAAATVLAVVAYLSRNKAEVAPAPSGGSTGGSSNATAQKNFGPLEFVPAPTADNPEAIRITNGWDKANITYVTLPGLNKTVAFHTKCKDRIVQLFQAWTDAGLIPDIIQWSGTWVPRFVRGSRTTLSNHAFATAFDINPQWNPMGAPAAPAGSYGNVQALAEIAKSLGWRWGGDYSGRPDGMHFELLSC